MKIIDETIDLGIIGGSGLYEMPGLEDIEEVDIQTPFGAPSTPIVVGTLEGKRVAFLARHGRGHHLSPSEINYRANIYGLKMLGVNQILSINACGSLREDFVPGHVVIPDQVHRCSRRRSLRLVAQLVWVCTQRRADRPGVVWHPFLLCHRARHRFSHRAAAADLVPHHAGKTRRIGEKESH